MKKETISLPKSFMAKQEDREEWVNDEETFEDDGLDVKGLMTFNNDSPDGNINMCDTDISQAVQGSSQNLEHTWFLDSGSTRHMTNLKSLLTDFVEKDGPMVVLGDNNEEAVMGIGTFECGVQAEGCDLYQGSKKQSYLHHLAL